MARLLLNLRHVPDDEADEVRALLAEHGIAWYETPPSRWAVSMGALWLERDADQPRARALLDDYQAQRAAHARADYQARQRRGEVPTLVDTLRERPAEVLVYLALATGIVALMMWPVWILLDG